MITYGYSVKENEDPYVELVDGAVSGLNEIVVPGAFLVDIIPSCESCPPRSRPSGDVNYGYNFFMLVRPTSQKICTVNTLIPALHPSSSSFPVPDSALRS